MARPLDPFRSLELPRDATLDDVKAAYRRLAKLYHPDSAGERALPRFLAVQAAYEALTEGPGRLRSAIGGRARPTTSRPGRPSPDGGPGRSPGTGPRAARGAAPGGAGTPGARPGSRAGSAAGGAAGFSASAHGEGGAGGHGGSSRARGTPGSRPRRTRRPPGSTSYDGAESEPFEPQWEGASWYGGSSGTYWTINPREFADPRKHGPEYQARGRAGASRRRDGRDVDPAADPTSAPGGPSRPRRTRPGDGRPAGRRGGAGARAASAGSEFVAGATAPGGGTFPGDDRWADDPWPSEAAAGPAGWSRGPMAEGPTWSARRSTGPDVSALSLVAAALFGLALVGGLFAVLTLPVTPGGASVVPVVAFSGIAIVALVRLLRRDGRPRL